MTTLSEPIDAALLGRERPISNKLNLQILPDEAGLVDVTLRVVLDPETPDERAAIDAFAPNGTLDVRYPVEINLEAERNELARLVAQIYRKSKISDALRAPELARLSEPELRQTLMPIAVRGKSFYRRLFQPPSLRDFCAADADVVRAALRSVLSRDQLVAIKSPVSLFPWTFLYDGEGLDKDNLTTLDVGRFWGLRHQIQEEIEGASPRVRLPRTPLIVAAVSSDLDANREHQTGPLGQFAARAPESLRWVDSAPGLRKALADFPGDCLYFYGHALQQDPPTPASSALRLNGVDLTVDEICEAQGPKFRRPLVLAFLNGCETTPPNVWNKDSLSGLFCLGGDHHVCCIATFAEVPAALARHFAQRFWRRFLDEGGTVGAALLGARRDLFGEFNNPLGLVYTLFGRIETRLG